MLFVSGILSSLAETKLILGTQGELKTLPLFNKLLLVECGPRLHSLTYPSLSFSVSLMGIIWAVSGTMLAFAIMSFMNQVGLG